MPEAAKLPGVSIFLQRFQSAFFTCLSSSPRVGLGGSTGLGATGGLPLAAGLEEGWLVFFAFPAAFPRGIVVLP
jgi:hypothetical protein